MKTVRDLIKELEALTEEQKDLLVLSPQNSDDDYGYGDTILTATLIREANIYAPEPGEQEFREWRGNPKNYDAEDLRKINPKKVIVIY